MTNETYYIKQNCFGELEVDRFKINLIEPHSEGENIAFDTEDGKQIRESLTKRQIENLANDKVITIKRNTKMNNG